MVATINSPYHLFPKYTMALMLNKYQGFMTNKQDLLDNIINVYFTLMWFSGFIVSKNSYFMNIGGSLLKRTIK